MKLKENQMTFNDWLYALKEAAKGKQEYLDDLGITQMQALEMLREADIAAYNCVIFYLITVARERETQQTQTDSKDAISTQRRN